MAAKHECVTAVPAARLVGDPVDVVTGAVIGVDREFQLPGPFELLWRRHYDSRRHREDAGCGLGFRFEYDRQLIMDLDGLRYLAGDGSERRFPHFGRDGDEYLGQGFYVLRLSEQRFSLQGGDGVKMELTFADPTRPARLQRLSSPEHAVSFGYNERGQLVTVADARGRALRVVWTAQGRMQRVLLSDPAHGLTDKLAAEYEYDAAGRMARTTDPYGHHLAYAYDKAGRLARFTDRNGYAFHYEYDERGRCIHTRGDDGVEELRLAYDSDARMTVATRGNGGQWQYFHDENLALTKVIHPSGGVTEYQYDGAGRLRLEVDPNKQVTTHEYDLLGHNGVNSLPTGEGVNPATNLDPFNAYLRVYRVHRAPVTAHQPHGYRPSTPARWECGSLLPESYALPLQDSRPRFLTADELSNLVTSDRPDGGLHRDVRDAFGVLIRQERDDGPARQFHHDPNGNPSRISDFDGHRTRFQQASWNHLIARASPLDAQSSFAYDSDENLIALVDENGNRSAFRYDLERHVSEIQRNGRVRERFVHDPAGNVIERQDANGRSELQFAYGDANLLVSRKLASGDEHGFEYGHFGSLATCTSAAGKVELNPTIDGGYHRSDLRDGKGVTHDLTWGGTDTTTVLERFELKYYAFEDGATQMVVAPGERVHRIRLCGSGVVKKELADGSRETVQYDPQGRVRARIRRGKDGAAHDTLYRYSGEGDLLQVIDSERGLTRYEYDAAHRLIAVHAPAKGEPDIYGYDPGGNLVRKPGLTYFGEQLADPRPDAGAAEPSDDHGIWLETGNRLHRVDGDFFVYDERDHLSERRSADGVTHYRYDELDRLVAIELADGSSWSAEYDALGRRTRKWVGQDCWVYYWNGDRLAAEILPDGKLRIYVYADRDRTLVPFGFVDFSSVDADPNSGEHYTLHTNHQGSVERVTDEAGAVVWQAELEPFGTARVAVGADFHQPLRFPGHYCDAETGLHYNRHRYYSPELGRYLQSDPADVEGGHNLYAYAQDSNPLRDVDLFGLACARAQAHLDDATARGLINEDGTPGKPLSAMSPADREIFCAARAAQLENKLKPSSASRTTICVMIVEGPGKEGPRVVVTSNHDSGLPPARVRDSLHPHEEARQTYPIIVNEHDGHTNPNTAKNRETVGNRDGAAVAVDQNGNATDHQKANARNPPPKGQTDHHAEQRAQNSVKPGESVSGMSPSRPCCPGCNSALTNSGNINHVPPDMRVR